MDVFRPHSHDAADSIDTALEANQRGIRAVKISFAALIVTALLQVVVLVATGSVALLADTIHNFSDALTAVPLFIAFHLSRRPATRRYTYGYRRAEDLAGIFVIAMITLSAVIAGYEAIDRLINPRPLDNLGWLFAAGLIGFAGNELVAVYRIRVGTPDRLGRPRGRRLPRPHRRVHLPGGRPRRRRCVARLRASRSHRRASHLRRHLRRPLAAPPARSSTGSWTPSTPTSSKGSNTPPATSRACNASVRCRPGGWATAWPRP